MSFLVIGILQAGNNNTLLIIFLALGAAFLLWFFLHIRSSERAGKEPLLSTSLFRNRTSNLGLVTQNIRWLLLMGITFVVSVFLQTERGFSAIKTGVIFTAETVEPGSTVHGRMYGLSIAEDPATGSANGPLGAYLVRHGLSDGTRIISEQGFEMGRPSLLYVRVGGARDRITSVHVGGHCTIVGGGWLDL